MLRVAIVEDEPRQAENLRAMLARFASECKTEIVTELFSNGMDFISDYIPCYDVVFMDIEMPYLNGMDCAFKLREIDKSVQLVFVTNMVQYAVKGYEVGAVGYIVKPLEYFPFSVLMRKVAERVVADGSQEIYIGGGDYVRRIYARDIYYIEVMDHYLIYHTADGEFRQIGKMKDVEALLGEADFFRCSNCYLVNLRHVRGIEGSEVTVGKDKIQISRRRKKEFLFAVNGYFRGQGD